MRLPLILAVLAAAAPAASAGPMPLGDIPVTKQVPATAPSGECPPISRYHAAKGAEVKLFQKLGDLPPADAYKAALRHDGRCEAPIIIRYGVGREQSR